MPSLHLRRILESHGKESRRILLYSYRCRRRYRYYIHDINHTVYIYFHSLSNSERMSS